MRNKTTIGLFIFLLAGAGMMAVGTKAAPASTEDEKAVQAAVTQFHDALNALFTGDVDLMKRVWSHASDVTYMGPTGGFRVGWSQVLANWEKQAAMKRGGKVTPKDMRITVGRDIAVTHNYEQGDHRKDGKTERVSIRATNVFRKEAGNWKMIGHHTDLLPFLTK
jgi:ketosteroid isomerase-like protein